MSNDELRDECIKHGVKVTDKHIENIQNLFEFLKVYEMTENARLNNKQVPIEDSNS